MDQQSAGVAQGGRNGGWGEARVLLSLGLSIQPLRSLLCYPLTWGEAHHARCQACLASLSSPQLLSSFQSPSCFSPQSFFPSQGFPLSPQGPILRKTWGPPSHMVSKFIPLGNFLPHRVRVQWERGAPTWGLRVDEYGALSGHRGPANRAEIWEHACLFS